MQTILLSSSPTIGRPNRKDSRPPTLKLQSTFPLRALSSTYTYPCTNVLRRNLNVVCEMPPLGWIRL